MHHGNLNSTNFLIISAHFAYSAVLYHLDYNYTCGEVYLRIKGVK